ncbi:LysM peptidoglycan-binding domain-containing protein [Streptomyces rhizoryzae]|uniref:LysM peptidoglycan-binding domain-containing protein n=1 Tax=Streptomyces rhizoryzae TaxID=2932493 RepID=UPI0027E3F7C9|nr:LysM peptidoglycan-binding domain-containing protein [Streptomyces rhizoryzae]
MTRSGIARPAVRSSRRRRPWRAGPVPAVCATVAAASAALALTSAAAPSGAAPGAPSDGAVHGVITGVGQPLRGAQVRLWVGSREGSRELGRARTDASGSFRIRYAPPARGVLYVEATSGRRMRLRAVVGSGSGGAVRPWTLNQVRVNELTTVAATYALAQFDGGREVAGPAPGLENAAATSRNLADPATGTAGPKVTDAANGARNETLATLGTLADLVSVCAADGPHCERLLRLATPPGGATPADTVQALLALAHHPTLSPSGLYALSRTAGHHSPALTAPPEAWLLALRYTDTDLYAPGRIAFDARGNAWATDNWLPGTRAPSRYVSVLDPTGRPVFGSPLSGGGMHGGAWGLAIDHGGAVWAPSYGGNAMAKYSATGTPLSPPSGWKNGGLVRPQGVAVDQRGNLWIANSFGLKGKPGLGSVVVYPHGDPAGAFTLTSSGLNHPFGLQIDGRGRAWVTNSHMDFGQLLDSRKAGRLGEIGGSVTVFGPDFKRQATLKVPSLQGPLALALDSHGNAWIPSFFNSTVTELRPDGSVAGVHQLPKTVFPWSIAVDGSDRIWVAGFGNASVSLLCGENTAACPPGTTTGTVLSPDRGFRHKAIQHLTAVQIDPSGNVWLANNWSKLLPPTGGVGLVQLVGAATPVCTPLTPLPVRPAAAPGQLCPQQPPTDPAPDRAPRAAQPGDHLVRPGDTLSAIAAAHGTTWDRLYRTNAHAIGTDPDRIRPGQHLLLP